jgi:hypothetical protein
VAEAGDHVEHAGRIAGLLGQLAQPQGGERRVSAGLRIIVQPAASAGATFHTAISSGKFHGMMAPTTPTGSRRVKPKNSRSRTSGTDSSIVLPSILVAQPAM